jgi:hypothetical protein
MPRRSGLPRVLAMALIAAACSDAGTTLLARLARNPDRGDAVIATFFWRGSINIIDSIADFVTDASSTQR